jgi:hypothetical protein
VVGRWVLAIPKLDADAPLPHLWQRLSGAVCRKPNDKRGRVPVNDSKRLKTPAAGLKHLEHGVLAFAALRDADEAPSGLPDPGEQRVSQWLQDVARPAMTQPTEALPWYRPADEALPTVLTPGELAIARAALRRTAQRIGVRCLDYGAAVVHEQQLNHMLRATRNKAAASFTFVAGHLRYIWDRWGNAGPTVVVDRQGGRTHYRQLLADEFNAARLDVLEESSAGSAYRLAAGGRRMTVRFEVAADGGHMPVALASMLSKYTRELMMQRFNAYWTAAAPGVAPTAGYGKDANRFRDQLRPHLQRLRIDEQQLRRIA